MIQKFKDQITFVLIFLYEVNNDTENNTLLLVWRKIKPEEIKNNLDNWRRKLPEFEIIEWNEQNFDINSIPFVKEAYDRKMFAFVSDVARLHALLTHGGVYLDTDIEIVKDFTPIINNYSAVFH